MKYFLLLLLSFQSLAETVSLEDLGFEYKFTVKGTEHYAHSPIYQNKNTGNCYTWREVTRGGSLSLVNCKDFGLDPKQLKKEREQEHAEKLRRAKELYDKLLKVNPN